jgi:uncharacterized protein (DUF362 family)
MNLNFINSHAWSRRDFLKAMITGSVVACSGMLLYRYWPRKENKTETFIASVNGYGKNLKVEILTALKELGITSNDVKNKRVLLKPNLVEPHTRRDHINTHPLIIQATAEAFLSLEAHEVIVGEGAGHQRDALMVLEDSGVADILTEDRIPFVDLNNDSFTKVTNSGKRSKLNHLFLPETIAQADIIVSLAKMKTHHWAGATLSMKNMFGVMPGSIYGWPKNVLHWAGIHECIHDISATVRPHLAIVDGIVGMEGDGPIMGAPIDSKVIVVGNNLPSVDATCCRVMGINPLKLRYLKYASGRIGTIKEKNIRQRGENIKSVRKDFKLLDFIDAHKGIRLG